MTISTQYQTELIFVCLSDPYLWLQSNRKGDPVTGTFFCVCMWAVSSRLLSACVESTLVSVFPPQFSFWDRVSIEPGAGFGSEDGLLARSPRTCLYLSSFLLAGVTHTDVLGFYVGAWGFHACTANALPSEPTLAQGFCLLGSFPLRAQKTGFLVKGTQLSETRTGSVRWRDSSVVKKACSTILMLGAQIKAPMQQAGSLVSACL